MKSKFNETLDIFNGHSVITLAINQPTLGNIFTDQHAMIFIESMVENKIITTLYHLIATEVEDVKGNDCTTKIHKGCKIAKQLLIGTENIRIETDNNLTDVHIEKMRQRVYGRSKSVPHSKKDELVGRIDRFIKNLERGDEKFTFSAANNCLAWAEKMLKDCSIDMNFGYQAEVGVDTIGFISKVTSLSSFAPATSMTEPLLTHVRKKAEVEQRWQVCNQRISDVASAGAGFLWQATAFFAKGAFNILRGTLSVGASMVGSCLRSRPPERQISKKLKESSVVPLTPKSTQRIKTKVVQNHIRFAATPEPKRHNLPLVTPAHTDTSVKQIQDVPNSQGLMKQAASAGINLLWSAAGTMLYHGAASAAAIINHIDNSNNNNQPKKQPSPDRGSSLCCTSSFGE